jgi:hypothetical protein
MQHHCWGYRNAIASTVWHGAVNRRLERSVSGLCEDDSGRPQREEANSLEHWGDDGGASGPGGRNSSSCVIDNPLPLVARLRSKADHQLDCSPSAI